MSAVFSKKGMKTIRFDGGFISVRSLSVAEILALFEESATEIARAFDKTALNLTVAELIRSDLVHDEALLREIGLILATHVPGLLLRGIAVAADVPDDVEGISKLPIDVLAAAVEQVVRLSVKNPKKARKILTGIGDLSLRHSSVVKTALLNRVPPSTSHH